jgi:lysophospholipase L1-like esterase
VTDKTFLQSFAFAGQCQLDPFAGRMIASQPADLPDGLHPNAAGYQRMGERFHRLAFQDGPFRE